MNADWQTLTAGAVVAITALIFLIRMARARSVPGGGCGGNCGCNKARRKRPGG